MRPALRFGAKWVQAPLVLPRSQINAAVPKAAMADAGVSWLLNRLREAAKSKRA
jgi:hypothetical protein